MQLKYDYTFSSMVNHFGIFNLFFDKLYIITELVTDGKNIFASQYNSFAEDLT